MGSLRRSMQCLAHHTGVKVVLLAMCVVVATYSLMTSTSVIHYITHQEITNKCVVYGGNQTNGCHGNTKHPEKFILLPRQGPPSLKGPKGKDLALPAVEQIYYQYVEELHIACPEHVRLGMEADGGWDLCISPPFNLKQTNCLVYDMGIGKIWTLDDTVSQTYGCMVQAYDPSMKMKNHNRSDLVQYFHVGIGGSNTVNKQGWPIRTFGTLLKENGHTNTTVDLLKMDVEYSEWAALEAMFKEGSLANVKQLMFEIHTKIMYKKQHNTMANLTFYMDKLKTLETLGFRKWLVHKNTQNGVSKTSAATNVLRNCCYELYYINTNFLNNTELLVSHRKRLLTPKKL